MVFVGANKIDAICKATIGWYLYDNIYNQKSYQFETKTKTVVSHKIKSEQTLWLSQLNVVNVDNNMCQLEYTQYTWLIHI